VKHDDDITYLRFVVEQIDEDSQMELGVFHAVGNLRDSGQLDPHEEEEHQATRNWFNENLEKPTRFTASKPPFHRKKSNAISWFKDSAHEHIARVRSLVAILRHHEVAVRMLRQIALGMWFMKMNIRLLQSHSPSTNKALIGRPASARRSPKILKVRLERKEGKAAELCERRKALRYNCRRQRHTG
jgi:epoxyqueuosine reductase QueG